MLCSTGAKRSTVKVEMQRSPALKEIEESSQLGLGAKLGGNAG